MQIATLIVEDNAFDTANNIVKQSTDIKAIKLSKSFLAKYAINEKLIGDDNSPFNVVVERHNHLEQNYFKKLFTHLTK